jgi:hypothetical protein
VPPTGLPGGERLGRRGQPGGQYLPLQIGPRDHLLSCGDDSSGLDVFDPEQVGQRGHRPLPELGEHPAPLQRGHRLHPHPLRHPLDRRPDPQHLDQRRIIPGFGGVQFDGGKLDEDIR